MSPIIFYTTPGCHLCEDAKKLLWPLLSVYGLRMQFVDIAESDELIARYGIRIPVVASPLIAKELDWPFTEGDVRDFFALIVKE